MKKTFRYRAKVSRRVEERLNDWLLKCREVFNATLANVVTQNGCVSPEEWDNEIKKIVQLQKHVKEQTDVDSEVLINVMRHKTALIEKCFKKKIYPGRIKTATDDNYKSFVIGGITRFKLQGQNFIIHKLGKLKLFLSHPILGDIKTVRIKKSATGEWFVNFHCNNVPENILPANNGETGRPD